MANQAKLRSFCLAPKYKYGFEVPCNYAHALQLDKINNDDKWKNCTKLDISQPDKYNTFIDLGKGGKPPRDYKKIKVHLVYDVKHDGTDKAWCVADGHLTDVPVDSVYFVVVYLRGLRMMVFLAKLAEMVQL